MPELFKGVLIMEEKIKEIVAVFTRIPADQISAVTLVDRSAVTSSIMLHRMYAKMSEAGIVVENYWDIKNFGNLLQRIEGVTFSANGIENLTPTAANGQYYATESAQQVPVSIGIDVEEINAMPRVNDFREEVFYQMNFAAPEIAYCILQPDPYASFAVLFAAKEAIVKADNNFRNKPFNKIIVDHLPEGKPVHDQFHLSVSHTGSVAVAVAVRIAFDAQAQRTGAVASQKSGAGSNSLTTWLILLSVLLSLCSVILSNRR